MEKICKIVYFDEDSVTDYVQIIAGGELENTTELLRSRNAEEEQNIKADGKVGISGIFKALLGWEAGVSADVRHVINPMSRAVSPGFFKTLEARTWSLGKESAGLSRR